MSVGAATTALRNCRALRDISSQLGYRYFSTHDSRTFLSTSVTENFSIPLTLTDVHLRHEHLPFAYAFAATLDSSRLISSLQDVLRSYPILGATVDFSPGKVPTLECQTDDTVPLSFGTSNLTLEEWRREKRSGWMQHVNWKSGGGPPILSPFFDDLSSSKWEDGIYSTNNNAKKKQHIATIRITYFRNSGTAIGININHVSRIGRLYPPACGLCNAKNASFTLNTYHNARIFVLRHTDVGRCTHLFSNMSSVGKGNARVELSIGGVEFKGGGDAVRDDHAGCRGDYEPSQGRSRRGIEGR